MLPDTMIRVIYEECGTRAEKEPRADCAGHYRFKLADSWPAK
jgi:hypothetical protein